MFLILTGGYFDRFKDMIIVVALLGLEFEFSSIKESRRIACGLQQYSGWKELHLEA
jgi:hypothetical protein